MSEPRHEIGLGKEEPAPGDAFWADRDEAFAAVDALAADQMSEALNDMLGEESARRQWLKEAALSGELELPELEDLAPLPDEGPDLG